MARSAKEMDRIYGIRGSWRYADYNDLNEVLNTIGVMAKRSKIPYIRVIIPPTKHKVYDYEHYDGISYYVPKNWRDCLYEDLETGDYYIVTQSSNNKGSWFAFKATGLYDGVIRYITDESGRRKKEILHHSGDFIDLLNRCNLNEILDTLAKNEKPIIIKMIQRTGYWLNDTWIDNNTAICKFDIQNNPNCDYVK